jgi:glyoxylase-like metal-dependent hydrolase (beta-lactamase superfamily II)
MTSPMPTGQVPGIYRKRFGDAVVTAVSDGGMPANPASLLNIELAESLAILDAARRPGPLMTAVNVFVIQSAGQTVLVDTGAGSLMVPTAGRMMVNLAAAGVAPGDVDAVLMTHLHIDHVGGLLTAEGAPAFPNADLLIPQGEADFWFDEACEAGAPEAKRPGFALARRMTGPYAGRVKTFSAAPAPGIEAVPLPGHTPGHTGFALGSGADRLLIWGDVMHSPEIQAARPAAAVPFDLDQALAYATRKAILAQAAEERLLVAGMHMHFPAFTYVVQAGDGYALRPIPWLTEL